MFKPLRFPPRPADRATWILAIATGLVAVLILGDLAIRAIAEGLWFAEVGYPDVFGVRLATRLGLFAIAAGGTASFMAWNWRLVQRSYPPSPVPATPPSDKWWEPPPRTCVIDPDSKQAIVGGAMTLVPLLGIVAILVLALTVMVLHYGDVALDGVTSLRDVPAHLYGLPPRFQPGLVVAVLGRLGRDPRIALAAIATMALVVALAGHPRRLMQAIAVYASLGFGLVLSRYWANVLQALHPTAFAATDPLFQLDISTYIFTLPLWNLLEFWAIGTLLYTTLVVTIIYLLANQNLSRGQFPGWTRQSFRHWCGLMGGLMGAIALSFGLACLELLYSDRGATYGAGFTDTHVQLPVDAALALAALVLSGWLLCYACTGQRLSLMALRSRRHDSEAARLGLGRSPWGPVLEMRPRTVWLVLTCYGLGAAGLGLGLPAGVQQLIVAPNELEREQLYIERSIAYTRAAFGLEAIDAQIFDPQGNLDASDRITNQATLDNIRLWDARPLLATNRQLQQIRLYYRFVDADIDRYTFLEPEDDPDNPPPSAIEQVMIAAREMDYAEVPSQAQTWVNEHLVYTHGYGFTLSPVNRATSSGFPEYYVKNIGADLGVTPNAERRLGRAGQLEVSSDRIARTIPTLDPRLYFGQLTDTYIMAPTQVRELDYPSGDENAYNHYDGAGGISLAASWRRWVFAIYLRDWQMLLTGNFTPDTHLLFRRNILRRVQAIAPFLTYDQDPYLVAVDLPETLDAETGDRPPGNPRSLYWILDAYTTSDRYPYSEPTAAGLNYIRNAVKVVIDAHSGHLRFYIADRDDPIGKTWQAIFPNLFQPFSELPAPLRQHIRYPTDLFATQSDRLLAYHMRDPQVFYNREDLWQIPKEIYGSDPQPVSPYFAILRLPTGDRPEFAQLLPFTPVSRNNLVAWLAARSDGGNYGKLLLYQFPKQQLVFGVEQVEARINQDPDISEQISLWNREGSRVLQGNLLVIPLARSLLYVEPLYLEAENTGLPTLVRVILAQGDRIVMAPTLDQALDAIFTPTPALETDPATTIVPAPISPAPTAPAPTLPAPTLPDTAPNSIAPGLTNIPPLSPTEASP
jgi:uncharacterized membrane protein (UPF0182 family)